MSVLKGLLAPEGERSSFLSEKDIVFLQDPIRVIPDDEKRRKKWAKIREKERNLSKIAKFLLRDLMIYAMYDPLFEKIADTTLKILLEYLKTDPHLEISLHAESFQGEVSEKDKEKIRKFLDDSLERLKECAEGGREVWERIDRKYRELLVKLGRKLNYLLGERYYRRFLRKNKDATERFWRVLLYIMAIIDELSYSQKIPENEILSRFFIVSKDRVAKKVLQDFILLLQDAGFIDITISGGVRYVIPSQTFKQFVAWLKLKNIMIRPSSYPAGVFVGEAISSVRRYKAAKGQKNCESISNPFRTMFEIRVDLLKFEIEKYSSEKRAKDAIKAPSQPQSHRNPSRQHERHN